VSIKYPHVNTNTLLDLYLSSEGKERDQIAEDLYERGKTLCVQQSRKRFQDVPPDVVEDMYHDALMETLAAGKPKGNFKRLLTMRFTWRVLDWIRDKEHVVPLVAEPEDADEEGFWRLVSEPSRPPADFEAREKLAQTRDCLSTLPERQRFVIQLIMDGLRPRVISRYVRGSVTNLLYHARQNLKKCLKERYGRED